MNVPVDTPIIRISPRRGWGALDLKDLWDYRELIYFLTWRDVKIRYKQTIIGVGWALLQPVALMGVFTLFFGRLANVPSGAVPYPLFAFAGLLPWQVFSRTLSESTVSLITDQRLISRVYFPRPIIPLATTLAALVDFGLASFLLASLMLGYHVVPSLHLVWLPLILLWLLAAALGVGFWLSALNVEYRDVMYLVPFVTQFWLFATPIVYPSSLVPPQWRMLYAVNPMVGVVEGFRWALFGTYPLPEGVVVSLISTIALLVSGFLWFRWRERTFIDTIGSGGH